MPEAAIDETHQHQGTWWLPAHPDRKVPGTFRWKGRTAQLELNEPLEDLPLNDDPSPRFQVVHGASNVGTLITVFDAVTVSPPSVLTMTGIYRPQKLSSLRVAIGAHLSNESKFRVLHAGMPGLQYWLNKHWYTQEVDHLQENTTVTFVARYPKPTAIPIPDGEVLLGFEVLPNANRQAGFGMIASGYMTVKPDQPQTYDWLLERFGRVSTLFSIMAGSPFSTNGITTVDESGVKISILTRLNQFEVCTIEKEDEFFLTEGTLGKPLDEVVAAWFQRFDSVDLPSRLAVDVLNDDGNTYSDFLAVMQALEGFHRGTLNGHYMDPAQYEIARKELGTHLPDEIQGDHRTALLRRIEHGNEFSLRRRMRELVKPLPSSLQLKILGKEKDLPGEWIDARNAYTHWFEGVRDVIDGIDLYAATQRLKMLLRVGYLRMVGVGDDAIEAAVGEYSIVSRQLKFLPGPPSKVPPAPKAP